MSLKAPYNFVPLNRKVVYPYWGKHISHDIPFKDGDRQSGTIDVKLKTHSLTFVMDGKKEEESIKTFSQFQNRHFIPGSSLKGMIRNVLEIMSFSKLANKVNDHRYAIRDLSRAAKSIYLDNFKTEEIQAGWLQKQEDGSYTIEDCGPPGRIAHQTLDERLGTDFSAYFAEEGSFDQTKDKEKAALFKYNRFGDRLRKHQFTEVKKDTAGRIIFKFDSDSKKSGTIVFTGQAGPRKRNNYTDKWEGHFLEFIFWKMKKPLPVDPEVMKNFFFAYYEHDKKRWSIDWKRWRTLLQKNKRIPVFFRKGQGGQVVDFGLSYLYKLPYKNSIREAIAHYQPADGIDLSEAIFGYVDPISSNSLKGRVHIGHAFANESEVDELKSEVLSSPKASYYPTYLRQDINEQGNVNGKYKTLMDAKPLIAGWKRYPIHQGGVQSNPLADSISEDVFSKFIPIKAGAEFVFKIRYHNLKKIELGALVSALTFHDTPGTFHSLGMAKPLGYGKVSISIANMSTDEKKEVLVNFEAFMDVALEDNTPWHKTSQLRELVTMVSEQNNRGRSQLAYMTMGIRGRRNEFVEAKRRENSLALDYYSKLDHIEPQTPSTLITDAFWNTFRAGMIQEMAVYKKKQIPLDLIEELCDRKKAVLYQLFEEKRSKLIQQINEQRAAKAIAERQEQEEEAKTLAAEKRRVRQIAAQENSPSFENVEVAKKNAFEQLKKIIQQYVEQYHAKKYEVLKKERKGEALLPTAHHEAVMKIVIQIFDFSNRRSKEKWQLPFERNANLKKVSEWIGAEKSERLLAKIKND